MHRIVRAVASSSFLLDLTFDDGREARVDLGLVVASAAVAVPFRDPDRFAAALTIVEDGEVLRWDDQFELHADSLRYRAFPDEFARDYGTAAAGRDRPTV